MSAGDFSRFDQLVSRYLDDELSPAEATELASLLGEPVFAARFLEITRLNSEITGLLAAPVPDAAMVELVRADIDESVAAVEHAGGARLRIAEQSEPDPSSAASVPSAPPLTQRRIAVSRLAWAAMFVGFAGLAALLVFNRERTAEAPVLALAQGEVRLEGPSGEHLLAPGEPWRRDTKLRTVGPNSSATMRFRDGSQLGFGANAVAFNEPHYGARSVRLEHGTVQAQVKKQPHHRPFGFVTPEAEAIVLGTTLRLTVGGHSTRLEVTEGTVQFRRRHDGAELIVKAGQYAIVAPNVPFAPTPFHPDPHHR